MKKTLLVALMGLMTIITANAAVDFENITITLMNNTVVKYNASQLSDVTYVGGQFGEEGAVGIKLYPTGSTSSVDFLYSQILSIVYNEQTTTTFTRITSTDQLEAGKRYIIVCEDASGAMGGAYNTNYRALVTEGITLNNGTAIVENESEVSIFTLGDSTGSWTFNDGSYYLANTSSSQLNSVTSADNNNAKWNITISNNNATITNKQNTNYKIVYYTNGEYFDTYSSGKTVQLYMEGTGGGSSSSNNVNANWNETAFNIPESGVVATSSSATYNQAWRIEYPHISTDANSTVVVHATSDYKISLSMEIDKSLRANRWSCYTMHNGVPNNNVGRYGTWRGDPCLPSSAQVDTDEYSDGKYTTNTTNLDGSSTTLFSRGHICASEDRQSLQEQNSHTFYTSNCHPQYQQHNGGLWGRMESKVQNWGYTTSFRDTLYVCKGATIANVTLDGTSQSGIIPYSEVKTKFGVTLTGSLTIPRYWYMAVLCLKDGEYHAMAFWSEQINSNCSSTSLASCAITIDELERRTGIDFFCNLPDDIEDVVEATYDSSFWNP